MEFNIFPQKAELSYNTVDYTLKRPFFFLLLLFFLGAIKSNAAKNNGISET